MSARENIFVCGVGAISPAGWGVGPLRAALAHGEPLPCADLARPGWTRPCRVRRVPAPSARPAFMAHPRLRRTSPIAHYAVGAALEALGDDAAKCAAGFRLGLVVCELSGCVNFSRRFYDEVLKDPATASPLVFPETVYNSSASHLAALLGTTAISYTLVGDPGTFPQGLALGADWLISGRVDGCVVIGVEEMDWMIADAARLFDRETVVSEGAGALYLKASPDRRPAVRLAAIADPQLFGASRSRLHAARLVRAGFVEAGPGDLLCDGLTGARRSDRDELSAWRDWPGPRLSPRRILGEGLMAAAGWQCVAAVDALQQNRYAAATVSIVGCNQQAIAAKFERE